MSEAISSGSGQTKMPPSWPTETTVRWSGEIVAADTVPLWATPLGRKMPPS